MKELHTEEESVVSFIYVFISTLLSNPGFMRIWQDEKLTQTQRVAIRPSYVSMHYQPSKQDCDVS